MNQNGCSTCKAGQEKWQKFTTLLNGKKVTMYQYDYRTEDGKLFSCCARTLEECRRRRDIKLSK